MRFAQKFEYFVNSWRGGRGQDAFVRLIRLDTGANFRKNASYFSDLSVYNNVDQGGACSTSLVGSLSVCGTPNTTVWIDKVVSAGLWAVVL